MNNKIKMKEKSILVLIIFFLIAVGCKEELPIERDLQNYHYRLVNQDEHRITFPENYKGKIVLLGLMFTNCPDICPMTTNNMFRIQQRLQQEKIYDVEFISLSFDPQRDTPFILKQYAEIRDINTEQWDFLTSNQNIVDSLKKVLGFMALAGDTSFTPEGKPYYFFVHTDRISLIDQESRIRRNYQGSVIDLEQIISDIKTLR